MSLQQIESCSRKVAASLGALFGEANSRSGLTRITFPGYTHDQLMLIIQSRLEGVPGNIVHADAVQFAARKVAAVSGDARRALDICRRAVEIAETDAIVRETEGGDGQPQTPSRTGRNKGKTAGRSLVDADEPEAILQKRAGPSIGRGVVTIATIKQAISEATSSPLQQALRALPLVAKVFLAALLARIRRTGIGEAVLGDVVDEMKKLGLMSQLQAVHEHLLTVAETDKDKAEGGIAGTSISAQHLHPSASLKHRDGTSKASIAKAARALGVGSTAIELAEAGIIGVETRHGERVGRVRLGVAEEEVRLALGDDAEVKGLGVGS
jgi:origin recognition complex subunit 1